MAIASVKHSFVLRSHKVLSCVMRTSCLGCKNVQTHISLENNDESAQTFLPTLVNFELKSFSFV